MPYTEVLFFKGPFSKDRGDSAEPRERNAEILFPGGVSNTRRATLARKCTNDRRTGDSPSTRDQVDPTSLPFEGSPQHGIR